MFASICTLSHVRLKHVHSLNFNKHPLTQFDIEAAVDVEREVEFERKEVVN